MMMKRAVALGAAFAAILLACGDDPAAPRLASLQPVGGTSGFSAVVGRAVPDSITVRAIGTNGKGLSGVAVRFEVTSGGGSISPTQVVTDAQGFARAQWTLGTAVGENTARASAEGAEPVVFTATSRADTLHRVIVTPSIIDFFAIGDTARLAVAGEDQYGNPVPTPNLAWRSEAPNVATVDRDGLVTATGLGTAEIIVTSRGVSGVAVVEVRQEPDSIAVEPGSITINALTFQHALVATVWDANRNVIANPPLEWTTIDASVAEVDPSGIVTAKGVGETMVIATARGVADTSYVLVRQVTGSVVVSPGTATAQEGDTVRYTAAAFDSAGVEIPDAVFTWFVTDNAVARVDADGLVSAERIGEAGVVAESEGARDTAEIRVEQLPSMASSGAHSCGLAANGVLHCWGLNSHGQLGTGNEVGSVTPVPVGGGLRFRRVAAGHRFTCATGLTGDVYCWGNADRGQLGTGNYTNQSLPTPVPTITDIREISLGREHACAAAANGDVYCWGANAQGQLGTGNFNESTTPVRLSTVKLTSVSAGFYHTCGLSDAGVVYCWGENLFGQLGDGTGVDNPLPVAVALGEPAIQVVSGAVHACALLQSGAARCWGDNFYGQLGNGEHGDSARAYAPVPAAPGHTFVRLEARGWYTCGIEASGTVVCWGDNEDGQLGSGSAAPIEPEPVTVTGGPFDYMTAGYFHSLGIRGGTAYAWGWNDFGQLGDNSTISRSEPVPVQGWSPYPGGAAAATLAGGGRWSSADPAALEARIEARLERRAARNQK